MRKTTKLEKKAEIKIKTEKQVLFRRVRTAQRGHTPEGLLLSHVRTKAKREENRIN